MLKKKLEVWRVGTMRFDRALALQHHAFEDRHLGHDDVLISLQHPPAITLGKNKLSHSILTPPSQLRALGIDTYFTARAGNAMIHLPGQPVLYPIVSLRVLKIGARRFIDILEDVLLGVARSYGIDAEKVEFEGGCWIQQQRQLGAVGIRVSGGVTMHGLALNAKPDLSYFSHIVPCGIFGKEATSLAKELGSADAVDDAEVAEQLVESFVRKMGYTKVVDRKFDLEELECTLDRIIMNRSGGRGRPWLTKLDGMEAPELMIRKNKR